ncbi:hypothetical protein B0H21DRAFT_340406 [Amylocystis lapponica]|nr:hypothetical protein B0H21DRAFT_340406 [Amylocystis lapponica]
MNATTLRSLNRTEVQRLAKANGIKANLKTDTIITILLERHQDGNAETNHAPPPATAVSLSPSHLGGTVPHPHIPFLDHTALTASSASARHLPLVDNGPVASSSSSTPSHLVADVHVTSVTNLDQAGPSIPTGSVHSPSPSLPPRDSNLDTSPQPVTEHTLRQLTKKMAVIAKSTEERRVGARALRKIAEENSDRATEVRALVHMLHAERVRMQTYFAHVRRVEPEWTDEAIYGETEQPIPGVNEQASLRGETTQHTVRRKRPATEATEDPTDGRPTEPVYHKKRRIAPAVGHHLEQPLAAPIGRPVGVGSTRQITAFPVLGSRFRPPVTPPHRPAAPRPSAQRYHSPAAPLPLPRRETSAGPETPPELHRPRPILPLPRRLSSPPQERQMTYSPPLPRATGSSMQRTASQIAMSPPPPAPLSRTAVRGASSARKDKGVDRSQALPSVPLLRVDEGKGVERGAPLPRSEGKGKGVDQTPAVSARSTRNQMAAKALARVASKRAHTPAVAPAPITEEEEEAVDSLSVIAVLSTSDDMEVDEAGDAEADNVQLLPMELAGLLPRPPRTPPEQYSRGPWF